MRRRGPASTDIVQMVTSTGQPTHRPAILETAGPTPAIIALVGWTLFVWGGRVRNIIADDQLAGSEYLWRLCLAVGLVALALAAAIPLAVRSLARFQRPSALALATIGSLVWLARGVDILLGDHETAFIVVHLVLAAVTLALSAWVVRRLMGNTTTPLEPKARGANRAPNATLEHSWVNQ